MCQEWGEDEKEEKMFSNIGVFEPCARPVAVMIDNYRRILYLLGYIRALEVIALTHAATQ